MPLADTHPLVRQAQLERLRAMPAASESQVILKWIEVTYGKELAERVAPFADRLGKEPEATPTAALPPTP